VIQKEMVYQILYQDILSWGANFSQRVFNLTLCKAHDKFQKDQYSIKTNYCKVIEPFIMGRVLLLMKTMEKEMLSKVKYEELRQKLEKLSGKLGEGGNRNSDDKADVVAATENPEAGASADADASGGRMNAEEDATKIVNGPQTEINDEVTAFGGFGEADLHGQLVSEFLAAEGGKKLCAYHGFKLIKEFAPGIPFGRIDFAMTVCSHLYYVESYQLCMGALESTEDRSNFCHHLTKSKVSDVPRLFPSCLVYPDVAPQK